MSMRRVRLAPVLAAALFAAGCQSSPKWWARKNDERASEMAYLDDETPAISPSKPERPSARMYVDFGYVRASMGQFPEAAGLFERAVKADPKCIDAYVGLAKVRSSMGHPDQAVEAVRKGLKHHPKSAALWNELGVAYTKMEKWREAADALQKAVKHDSDEGLYRSNLAGVLVVAGDLDRAYRLYSEQMTAADAHCQIARILGGQGRMQECQKHVQLALLSDPGHAFARTLQSQLSDPQLRTVGYRGAAGENARPIPPSAAPF